MPAVAITCGGDGRRRRPGPRRRPAARRRRAARRPASGARPPAASAGATAQDARRTDPLDSGPEHVGHHGGHVAAATSPATTTPATTPASVGEHAAPRAAKCVADPSGRAEESQSVDEDPAHRQEPVRGPARGPAAADQTAALSSFDCASRLGQSAISKDAYFIACDDSNQVALPAQARSSCPGTQIQRRRGPRRPTPPTGSSSGPSRSTSSPPARPRGRSTPPRTTPVTPRGDTNASLDQLQPTTVSVRDFVAFTLDGHVISVAGERDRDQRRRHPDQRQLHQSSAKNWPTS